MSSFDSKKYLNNQFSEMLPVIATGGIFLRIGRRRRRRTSEKTTQKIESMNKTKNKLKNMWLPSSSVNKIVVLNG